MSKKSDVTYGRQGGRIVDFVQPIAAHDCEICGCPIVTSDESTHRTCREAEDVPQRDSFGRPNNNAGGFW